MSELTPEQAAIGLESWFICELIYAPFSALIRTSIGVFLLRVAVEKSHRLIIHISLALVWLSTVVFFFIVLFQCSPPSHFWEQVFLTQPGSCGMNAVPAAGIELSAINAVCDFILALLPIAMMWKVQLNRRTKLIVAALLSMGVL